MAAITKPSLLRLFTASLARRPAAAAAAVATTASRGTGSALLRSGHGCHRLTHAAQRLAALHGSAVVCSAAGDDVVEVQLKVDGMVCEGCSSRVEEALQKMAGVKKVQVDLEKGLATVQVEAASQIDAFNAVQPLAEAIKGLGFEAEPHFGEG
ncbi:hypothetical protein CHLNCDRAFT_145140 [Chlorella variabilis]|uniref:HMA domain-containing protein n=1 Tax=Chlorella variabilis TaxID=554065 RepID=E1ZCP1_CHLVA|nr:hypothetical protein CHLNCDRAFT_145140 [Chlorella variabilis]EFN56470.1 hypothetical protein CHLNCDRAFT_145140 [Chlorella variabilis]|eukprot:XP_005848572.1 hypothetical protein CHLNCDRAFT_145140 [Chlorella variabilis]